VKSAQQHAEPDTQTAVLCLLFMCRLSPALAVKYEGAVGLALTDRYLPAVMSISKAERTTYTAAQADAPRSVVALRWLGTGAPLSGISLGARQLNHTIEVYAIPRDARTVHRSG
jgi:hypothetical protein